MISLLIPLPSKINDRLSSRPSTRPNMIILRVMLTAAVVLMGMTALEAVKQLALPDLSWWEPQISVVIISALVSTLTAYFALRQYRQVLGELEKWQLTVQEQNDQLVEANTALQIAVSERETSQAMTERQLQRITALRDIDMAIASSLDLRVTVEVILDQVQTQLHTDAARVLLLDPQTRTLEYFANRGFLDTACLHSHLRLGEGNAGRAALERRAVIQPDLAQDDNQHPPGLRQEPFASYAGVPLIAKGEVQGVLEVFHRTRFAPEPEWLNFLEVLAGQTAIAIDNANLLGYLQSANAELQVAYDTTLEGWSRALDLRDKETEGHTQRVTKYTLHLARACGISESELLHVQRGALLHDIGKMGIPDNILLKPGPLNDEEWVIMKKHPRLALELLSPIPYLRPALEIPYCHHEKWDGSGYPRGLKGEEIPLAARIFAVIDVWDALRSDRPYRAGWPVEKALQHIRDSSGTHFDPQIVQAFEQLGIVTLDEPRAESKQCSL
ncbi:MAG: hypothetical protein JWN98_2137 [Abditibacteriota bacterium]|nr:hypothetical protein [Abditibacteriota bacterium]